MKTRYAYKFAGILATMLLAGFAAQAVPSKNPQSTISFNVNGGTPEISSIIRDEGSAVTRPADPTKADFTFAGWLPDVPTTMPAADLTCVAQWTATQTQFTVLHTFAGGPGDGGQPMGSLTLSADGSTLYGATKECGANNNGAVFSMGTNGGSYTLLASFSYGTGYNPYYGALLLSGSTLYGMTYQGGGEGAMGTVFSLGTGGGTPTVLHSFAGATDGSYPFGVSLTLSGSTLYGLTYNGGANSRGTIFSVGAGGGATTILYSFPSSGDAGNQPRGGLTLSGSTLYGMTGGGGATVFSEPIGGGTPTIMHTFAGGSDGLNPYGSLTPSADGTTLYGMTSGGGANSLGTIFKIGTDGNGYTILYSFTGGSDAQNPYYNEVTLSADGTTLYGMTYGGGANSLGTIFEVGTDGNGYTTLYSFTGGSDGSYPRGSLTLSADGTTLYGMAPQGGSNSYGTVFSLEVPTAKSDQTISGFLPTNGSAFVQTSTVGLSATASSGLSVTFTTNGGPASIDGTNLTFSGAGTVSIVASQAGNGSYNAAPSVTNLIHVYALSANSGAYAGGNTITITNGNIGTITNVLVGGVRATITASGANWFTITLPATGSAGAKDIVVQTSDNGDITLGGVYTVNPAGYIGGATYGENVWTNLGIGVDNFVFALAHDGTNLYAGGDFSKAGGVTANRVAKWNGTSWTNLGSGIDNSVWALAQDGANLYAGEDFRMAGGVSTIGIANGTSWSRLVGGRNITGYDTVYALTTDGTNLYASGAFTTSSGATANYIEKWDGTSWSSLASGMDGAVYALMFDGTELYAGGNFTFADGVAANRVAKWDGTSWSSLGAGMNGTVYALATDGTNLYAGGGFSTADGAAANRVAKWDGKSWSSLGAGMNSYVKALAFDGANLYASGLFTNAGGVAASRVAKWDGTSWTGLGSGMNESVYALAVDGTNLYAGGQFTAAGGLEASCVAKWGPTVIETSGVAPSSGSCTGGYEVVISGANLGNGSDITSVTLCGVSAASITSQSSTQIVVVAGAGTAGPGDVRVFSTSYGETVKSNGFTYLKADQTITFPAIGPQLTTNRVGLAATASSGLTVTFTTNGGPASIDGTNLTFTSAGTVSIVASQAGDANWNAAPSFTNTFTVTEAVLPPSISSQPVSAVVTTGTVASLSVTNSGTGPFGYQWMKDGVLLTNQTSSMLSFSSFKFTDSGSYSVVITNALGMTISVPASLSTPNASLQTWGFNVAGQLGNGTNGLTADANRPITVAPNGIAAAGGYQHSLFVKADGTLWAMGNGWSGVLGNGSTAIKDRPIQVTSNVVSAAGGNAHSLFVKADGTLWAMGANGSGQLGNGTKTDAYLPVQVASNVVAAAGGHSHSLFVKADGTLWAMGANGSGQLGNGTWDSTTTLPIQVASNVVAAACGKNHSLFMKADGTLWAMGYNNKGQLGNGTTTDANRPIQVASNVVAAAGGNAHSLFVKADGTLWAMGWNSSGQLGNGSSDSNPHSIPVQVASNVVAAAGGSEHALFVKSDGTLWAMGQNTFGQLGNGTTANTNWPVQVTGMLVASLAKEPMAYHSLAIAFSVMTDQTISFPTIGNKVTTDTVGLSATASSGLTVTFTTNGGPAVITGGTNLTFSGAGTVSIVASQAGNGSYNAAPSVTNLIHVYALSANSGAYAGGNTITITNGNIGTITNVLVGGVRATITASGANWFTITLPATGSTGAKDIVVQTSDNGDITLTGVYTVNPAGVIGIACDKDPQAAISAGYGHSLALKRDGSIIGWGDNGEGQTNAPAGTNFVAVAAGNLHSLALKTDGSIIGWGNNGNGQTNAPAGTNFVAVAAGNFHSLALKTDGSIIGWGYNDDGQINAPAGTNFVAVAAGGYHSLALKTDGSIIGWGRTTEGQTNAPAGTNFVAVAAGNFHSLALKTDGSIIGWGWNDQGQTNAPAGTDFVAVAAGSYHFLALKTDGSIIGWGRNNEGQTNAPAGTNFVAVAAGEYHSLALKTDGSIIGWGGNDDFGLTNVPAPNADFGVCGSGVAPSSGSWTGGYEVVISGTNLCNGSDITGVTLCGVSAASITSQSSTQIVVVAGAGTAGLGDVRVFSTSYGETVKANAFTYLKNDQTITFPAITNKVTTDTVGLSATASSGLPVTFTTNGGPAIITGGTNLTFTGAGSVSIVASQAGNSNYNAAASVTNTFSVTAAQPIITSQPVGAVVTMGGTASLSVSNSGTGPFGYQWMKDGVLLSGKTNSTLSFSPFNFTDSGSYSVVITNAQGMTISLPANLSVPNAPLRTWGNNSNGQLGNGTTVNTNRPITVASNVVAAAGGQEHSLFVKADGTLWAMGLNEYGQLGNGTTTETNLPVWVASNVVAAVGGFSHSLFVKADGTLWAMGNNSSGQLGNGTTGGYTNLPVQVASNVVSAAAGERHSLFVKADGTLWAMGYNGQGQLGNGTKTSTNLPIQVASNVVAAAGGGNHSLFVKSDGTLWAMGWNFYGQLGNGTSTSAKLPTYVTSNVVAAAGGGYAHTLFLKTDGTLWAMGNNENGQLGIGSTTIYTNLPVQVASNVVAAACGYLHSLFVKSDGTLWAMGDNQYGQLGDGTTNNASLPVQVNGLLTASLAKEPMASHSLAIAGALAVSVSNQAVTVGQTTSFTASVIGDDPFAYQWQFSGTNIVNATNDIYTIASAALTNAGNYAVIVAGTYGTTTSAVATLTVNNLPPPPTALSAVDITANQFTARWTSSEEATNYLIDVSATNAFTSSVGVYSNWSCGDATACLVTGLADGGTYYYRVRAANQYGSSLDSNIIEVPVSTNTPYIKQQITNGVASAGSGDVLNLNDLFHGVGKSYQIINNSNTGLVSAVIDAAAGTLSLEYKSGGSGTATLTVREWTEPGYQGFYVDTEITVYVTDDLPTWSAGSVVMNLANGLFEQTVSVTNISAYPAQSVTLTVSNITAGAKLYNATGTDPNGNSEIHWVGTLGGGASMNFKLQYYTAQMGITPTGTVSVSLSLQRPDVDLDEGNAITLSGQMKSGSNFIIGFNAIIGKTYYIQYASTVSGPWETAYPPITALTKQVQWVDSGPPVTEPVGSVRFYRVIQVD